jgi:pantoate--beta-alanine ligase
MISSTETKVIETIAEMRTWRESVRTSGGDKPCVGFVPTMGALHEGHLTLVRKAVRECRHTLVSIFVNPMQFGPNEDFDRYPRSFEKDLQMIREAGAEILFHPGVSELYPNGHASSTKVVAPTALTERLCGQVRPGHFSGVTTVVLKLFSIIQPDVAYFGEKDFQQLTIIKRMAQDLDLPVAIAGVPTVREMDGLALSSRNVYLTSTERKRASELYKTLCWVREESLSGRRTLEEVLHVAGDRLNKMPEFSLQYLEACDPATLEPLKTTQTPMVILVAAKLGSVRLIDNLLVT